MRQGDLFWINAPDRSGRRPALVLTRSSAIGFLNAVTVAHVTTTIRAVPTEVLLMEEDGMPERSVVNLDNIHTVRTALFGPYIAHLSPARMHEVRAALEFALGFEEMH